MFGNEIETCIRRGVGSQRLCERRLSRAVANDVARNTLDDIPAAFRPGLQKPIPAITDD